MKMTSCSSFFFMLFFVAFAGVQVCLADCGNLQDTCPVAPPEKQTIFINGLPCNNKANTTTTAEDFKTTELSKVGTRDNLSRSSTKIVTASEFPGLNTLGLSIGRTDIEVDGMVNVHNHPRATEMIYVNQGVLLATFLDTNNKVFKEPLRAGDVFVIPKGLYHFFQNQGSSGAIVFSVFNSQNPGVVSLTASTPSATTLESLEKLKSKFASLSDSDLHDSSVLEIFYS